MLALLGLVGLAMSSFVMIGNRDETDDDNDPGFDPQESGMGQNGGDAFADLLLDTSGDDGAGALLDDNPPVEFGAEDVSADAGIASGGPFADDLDDDYADELLPDPPLSTDDTAPMTTRFGSAGDDQIDGDVTADEIFGDAGDDRMTGNLGDDLLYGGDGNDALNGGTGNDLLDGGDGDDIMEGGFDDDTLIGGLGADLLNGGGGNDLLDGRDADDGFDYLNGGAGDDVLLAGYGDHLNGGDGADTFSLLTGGNNVIDDFDPAQDVLEVTFTGPPPVLTTAPADDGLTLLADDAVVAHLSGVTDLDLSRIVLIAA